MKSLGAVYEYDDYKKYFADWLKFKSQETRGIQSRLAEALQCHSTHITLILRHENHLSIEQAGKFSRFAEHSSEEALFFQMLLHRSRAGDSYSRELYDSEIRKKIQEKLNQSIQAKVMTTLSEEAKATYYSSWFFAAIHMAVTLPELRTKTKIASTLGLSPDLTESALDFLTKTGLIRRRGSEYEPGKTTIHLSRNSNLGFRQHINWRLKVIELLSQGRPEPFHYTSIITMAKKDEPKVRQILQEAVDRSRALIADSKEESMFCLAMDWFKV